MPINAMIPIIDVNDSVLPVSEQRDQPAGDAERDHAEHDQHRAEAAELEHQHREDAEHRDQHRDAEAGEALAARLDLAGGDASGSPAARSIASRPAQDLARQLVGRMAGRGLGASR